MARVEAVINSRPLTVEIVSDSNSLISISPSNKLTMKTSIVMPPPGTFPGADLYCKKEGDVFNTFQINFGQDGKNNF